MRIRHVKLTGKKPTVKTTCCLRRFTPAHTYTRVIKTVTVYNIVVHCLLKRILLVYVLPPYTIIFLKPLHSKGFFETKKGSYRTRFNRYRNILYHTTRLRKEWFKRRNYKLIEKKSNLSGRNVLQIIISYHNLQDIRVGGGIFDVSFRLTTSQKC